MQKHIDIVVLDVQYLAQTEQRPSEERDSARVFFYSNFLPFQEYCSQLLVISPPGRPFLYSARPLPPEVCDTGQTTSGNTSSWTGEARSDPCSRRKSNFLKHWSISISLALARGIKNFLKQERFAL